MGIYISAFAFLAGFALVWHILWLAVLGLVGVIVCIIIRSFDDDTEYVLTAAEVAKIEKSKSSRIIEYARAIQKFSDSGSI